VISEPEAASLTEQYISLKGQRSTLQNALPTTTDPGKRAQFIDSIGLLTRNMQLLEYRLRSAGRPVP